MTVAVGGVHLLSTTAMAGLIWMVQVVHYPLFAAVGRSGFVAYEREHTRRISFVVGPLMAAEGVTALWLLTDPGDGSRSLAAAGVVLLAVVHASTVLFQVPAHRELSARMDTGVIERLVATNWIRTLGWTARAGVALVLFAQVA